MSPLFAPIFAMLDTVIQRIWPDPEKQMQAQIELLKLQQTAEFKQLEADIQLAVGQMSTNSEEAKNQSVFVAGWRPFIGWVCGTGFAVQFVVGPFASWGSALLGHPIDFPKLDLSDMLPILFGMLGLGAYRTYEKVKGTK